MLSVPSFYSTLFFKHVNFAFDYHHPSFTLKTMSYQGEEQLEFSIKIEKISHR
jgi:hypothetical protein